MIINSDYSTFCIPKIWEDKRGFCPHSSLFHAFSRQDQNRLQSFFTLHLFYLQYPVNFPYFWFLLYLFKSSFFKCTNVSRIFPEKERRDPFFNSFSKVAIDRVFRQSGILFTGCLNMFSAFLLHLEECFIVHSWSIFRTRLRESNNDLHRKNDDVKVWETRSIPFLWK